MSRIKLGIACAFLAAPAFAATSIELAPNGRATIRSDETRLEDLKRQLEQSPLKVELRIAAPDLLDYRVTARVTDRSPEEAVQRILAAFNYTMFEDPTSGRQVYLITSLGNPNAPVVVRKPDSAEVRAAQAGPLASGAATNPAGTVAKSGAFPEGRGPTRVPPPQMAPKAAAQAASDVRSLDDVRPVDPVAIPEPYAPQDTIDAEVNRRNAELAARAREVLASGSYSPTVQQQALNELITVDQAAALSFLQRAIDDSRVADNPTTAAAVAQAAWRLAAQQQFANADTNRLLQSLANSTHPQFQSVGQAALRDQTAYNGRRRR